MTKKADKPSSEKKNKIKNFLVDKDVSPEEAEALVPDDKTMEEIEGIQVAWFKTRPKKN